LGLWQFDKVRAVLAVPDCGLRSAVRQSITNHGLTVCREANGLDEVCDELRGGDLDLLITVPEMAGADVGAVIQRMRHNRLGENPFVVVMTLIENPNPELVRRVVDAGVDDVLLMPMAPAQVVGRLNNFVYGRKPFIVTHDYIGPERRSSERDGGVASMAVPNPIRWHVIVNSEATSLSAQIRDANARMNVHKMKSYCGYITSLIDHMVAAYQADRHGELKEDAVRLGLAAEDLTQRMGGTSFSTACELVQSVQTLSERLARPDRKPRPDEVDILPTLSYAIQHVFDEDHPDTVAWTDLATVV
jgi:DNA-binding response OmpR family regulator